MARKFIVLTILALCLCSSVSFAQQAASTLYEEDESIYHWSEKLLSSMASQYNLSKSQQVPLDSTLEANSATPLYNSLQEASAIEY